MEPCSSDAVGSAGLVQPEGRAPTGSANTVAHPGIAGPLVAGPESCSVPTVVSHVPTSNTSNILSNTSNTTSNTDTHTHDEVGRNRPIESRGDDRARDEREPLSLYVLRRVRWDGTVLLEAGEMTELTSRGHSLSDDRSMQERPMAPPVLSQAWANVPYDRPEQECPMAPHTYNPRWGTQATHTTPHTTHHTFGWL